MSKINPTPWSVKGQCGAYCYDCSCSCSGTVVDANGAELDYGDPETVKLIAAAPEMLELLINVADFINRAHYELDWYEPHDFLVKCQKVLKKAKGES